MKMNPENGQGNEIGYAYLEQEFSQNNSEYNSNFIDLLNMSANNFSSLISSSSNTNNISFFNSTSNLFEPLQLNLNPTLDESRHPKNFVTERQRRQTFNDKFQHLRSLLPNPNKTLSSRSPRRIPTSSGQSESQNMIPTTTRRNNPLNIEMQRRLNETASTKARRVSLIKSSRRRKSGREEDDTKNDRASIIGDAIEYIKELIRTVKELKILVEKKRSSITNVDKNNQLDQSLRSSWLQRKCKDTEIDVRIVDDEVTIKVVQRKKMFKLLLYVSKTFDDLQLDLQHVTGGQVGDYYSFLFNTKISEGSSLYASAIANKLMDVVDGKDFALQ